MRCITSPLALASVGAIELQGQCNRFLPVQLAFARALHPNLREAHRGRAQSGAALGLAVVLVPTGRTVYRGGSCDWNHIKGDSSCGGGRDYQGGGTGGGYLSEVDSSAFMESGNCARETFTIIVPCL